jgi:alpha-L-fucosidase
MGHNLESLSEKTQKLVKRGIMDQEHNLVKISSIVLGLALILAAFSCQKTGDRTHITFDQKNVIKETKDQKDLRMKWWREARFGLFIHWGLYAIPAGEWKGETNHAEWILTTAQIPVDMYEKFAPQFNPTAFNPAEWVKYAKDAGMKYIVITSKHHDGFCLFDSKHTVYDVIDATPFKRDILRELAEECQKQGLKMCFYHSIMDWHHPDYLPRRSWENRTAEGADFDRYVDYMKKQVAELLTNYGDLGVLWFDGEWEYSWEEDRGRDLYNYVRSFQPAIIVNNRVGKGREGMAGTYDPEASVGDFGTPEQEIPATGLAYDWETCMTMNDHWGYNKNNHNWKTEKDLIRKLVDIASKGGNFLLNVGPTAEGLFPQESIKRLQAMGNWLNLNGESIYGTTASQFENLTWGRSTTKPKKLFFHVFDWPSAGKLMVPGLLTEVESAYLMVDPETSLETTLNTDSTAIYLPEQPPDPIVTVIVCEFDSDPEVVRSAKISAECDIFCDDLEVTLYSHMGGIEIRYTLEGTDPIETSPLYQNPLVLEETATVKCRIFRSGQPISPQVEETFTKVEPRPSEKSIDLSPGLEYRYYEGQWEKMPNFESLAPADSGFVSQIDLSPQKRKEDYGLIFRGYLSVEKRGVYTFALTSDDGSRLFIGEHPVVDNDGLHGPKTLVGHIALESGFHPIAVTFFQRSGGAELEVKYHGPGLEEQIIPATALSHEKPASN